MILTTTNTIQGHTITSYKGIVVGEAIMGANIVRDFFASVTDVIGGRSGAYESKLQDARAEAMAEIEDRAARLGANARPTRTSSNLASPFVSKSAQLRAPPELDADGVEPVTRRPAAGVSLTSTPLMSFLVRLVTTS